MWGVMEVEADELLRKPAKLRRRIESLKSLYQTYEAMANSIPTGSFDEPRVDKTPKREAPFVKWIDKILDTEKKLGEARQELAEVTSQIMAVVDRIENSDFKVILMKRYLDGATWTEIASAINVAERTVYRWAGMAKEEFESLLSES